jgi:hypothetical protein
MTAVNEGKRNVAQQPITFSAWGSMTSQNKRCLKILQERLLNRAFNDWLPLMVGQSHDSFTLLSVRDVMLFQPFQQAIQVLNMEYRQEALWSKPECQVTCFCVCA